MQLTCRDTSHAQNTLYRPGPASSHKPPHVHLVDWQKLGDYDTSRGFGFRCVGLSEYQSVSGCKQEESPRLRSDIKSRRHDR